MNIITTLGFCFMTASLLSGCFSQSTETNLTSTSPSSVTTPDLSTTLNTSSSPTTPSPTSTWQHIPMHYGLLKGQSHIWGESGGLLPLVLQENAPQGSTKLQLNASYALLAGQLITYRGSNQHYYTTTIQRIDNNTLHLGTPLQHDVWAGNNAWNFYHDPSHPNQYGYQAIADFAIEHLGYSNLNFGRHALLGDSWFDHDTLPNRLQARLDNTTVINLGIGGNTCEDLITRFEKDVPMQRPDFVWVLCGTNDYWQQVPANTYQQNIQILITRIEALGAQAIIIDPSVAPLYYGSLNLTQLSHTYTQFIQQLLPSD